MHYIYSIEDIKMSQSRSSLPAAHEILNQMNNEKISSSQETTEERTKISLVRKLTNDFTNSGGYPMPGMTANVASTLLKVGLCQELSQRYALEYIIKYQRADVNLIFTNSLPLSPSNENHGFVYIGKVNAPDALFIGRGNANSNFNTAASQTIESFFANNKEGQFADPFLNCAGNSQEELANLFDYFKKYKITHVIGVKSYAETLHLVENAATVKQNASRVAEQVKPYISFLHSNFSSLNEDRNALKQLIKKYSLPDTTQASIEKGLRNAATNNQLEDLKLFTKAVQNINATDSNAKVKRTALHWAAIKGHTECYQWLLEQGAVNTIADADGKTANDYYAENLSVKNLRI